MKPAEFDYYSPRSVEECLSLLSEFGSEAKILAGGQSLVPLMNMRFARPARIIDINALAELNYVTISETRLCVGALTRHRTIEQSRRVADYCPLLSKAVCYLGHPQVRSRGTIGGSIVHSDPAAEYPAVVAALDGEVLIKSLNGTRLASWKEFFLSHFTVGLAPDEMVIEVRFPIAQKNSACEFLEISRRHGDFAIVETAVLMEADNTGRCTKVAIGLGGVGATPHRARFGEEILQGQRIVPDTIREAAECAIRDLEPDDDIHGSSNYRKQMARVLITRALQSSLAALEKVHG